VTIVWPSTALDLKIVHLIITKDEVVNMLFTLSLGETPPSGDSKRGNNLAIGTFGLPRKKSSSNENAHKNVL
jgi:hypothetical protein